MIKTLNCQIKSIKSSIVSVEQTLSKEEFRDYCDHAYSCIAYLEQSIIKLKKEKI